MKNEKTYCNAISIKSHTFADGNEVLNLYVRADKLREFLDEHEDDKGAVRLVIGRRKEPDKYENTHSIWKDTYQPKQKPLQKPADDGPFANNAPPF